MSLLGLARRAGRVAIGARSVDATARRGRLAVLLVAGDASENAISRLGREARAAPRLTVGSREQLGRAVGRGEVAVAGVSDPSLARRMLDAAEAPKGREHESGNPGDPERQVP